MGKTKYLTEIKKFIEKTPVFSISSINRIVKDKKYTRLLLHNLFKKGKIKRLSKGIYSASDEPSLAVLAFKPAYLGLQDSLSFHNLWEQETIRVIITAKKVRARIRNFDGTNFIVKRINRKYFFGFEYYKQGSFYLPYSDIEKTFIDLVYFKQKIDKETIKEIRRKIDIKKLKKYLKKYHKKFMERVLNLI